MSAPGRWRLAAALLVLLAAADAARAARAVPFLAGRVVDEAAMIPPAARERIEARLRDLEQATGAQVAVLTVETLEGDPLEEFTMRVADTWKLGGQERDDGVLFFVARADRKMRLEVGYGLEDRLTDLRSGRILDEVVKPRFKAGDFEGGIEEGVKAVEAVIRGGEAATAVPAAPAQPGSGEITLAGRIIVALLFLGTVCVFSAFALMMPGGVSWTLYAILMPFHCVFPMAILTPWGGMAWFALWVVGFPFARRWVSRRGWAARWLNWLQAGGGGGSAGWSSGSSWSSGGGSWGSSSGGSSFSGGGGSFGGGGASSSW